MQQLFRYLQQRALPAADLYQPVDPAQFRRGRRSHLASPVRRAERLNRQQWLGPMLNPTSTQFGEVTTVALNQMGFFWFGVRGTFQVRRSLGEGGTPLLVRSRGPRGPAPLTRRTRSRSCAEHLEFTSFGRERR